jgi:hypothetical protein
MNIDSIKQILVACVADDAPVEALFQARDIFEIIMAAGKTEFEMPEISLSPEEGKFIRSLFADNGIDDRISFYSLLGCADLLMNSSAEAHFFQARRLFQVMLKTL